MNIKDYWIDELKNIKEFKELATVENAELSLLQQEIVNLIDNQLIETSTENGIARREKILSIRPYGTDTLETRRFRVELKWNDQLPYSTRQLINKLNSLVGEEGYVTNLANRHLDMNQYTHAQLAEYSHTQITTSANYDPSTFTVTIKINIGLARILTETKKVIRSMIPCNMTLNLDLRYNRYMDLGYHSYLYLSAKTYKELKEVAL